MKRYVNYLKAFSLLALCLTTSCDLEKANVNPNNPEDAPISALLTSSEVVMSYIIGSDAAQHTGIFVQQVSGVSGDVFVYDSYSGAGDRFDLLWNTLYSNSGSDLVKIIEKAKANNSPHYAGVAKVLLAYSLGILTDLYGDIPYAEAFQGSNNQKPTFQPQEQIYAEIQRLLTEAIQDCGQGTSLLKPGNDDVLYKGDLGKWIAAAWTLKARYALHLSKLDATKAATEALDALYNGGMTGTYRGIANNGADLQLNFLASATQASPWWQQNTLRPSWFVLGAAFVNELNGTGPDSPPDPRRAFFATPVQPAPATPEYKGSVAGKPVLPASNVGPFYGSQTSPVPLITFVEARFIEAEARLILNENDPKAEQAMQQAIQASFEKVGATAVPLAEREDFLLKRGSFAGATTFAQKLSTLISQKYVALFTQPEVWTDYRRTGYPVLTPAVGSVNGFNPSGSIPRRIPYPISEITYNADKVPSKVQSYETPRLWWDK
jgi:hypothetical protein